MGLMRVHHLNCGTMRPASERLVNGAGSMWKAGRMVCHCLLIETDRGLVLVDSGMGLDDVADPAGRLGKEFLRFAKPTLVDEETAARQIEGLGFRRADVRHIVLTHMDLDHAGALSDFPDADVHVYEAEHAAAMAPATYVEKKRYRASQWAHGPRWKLHATAGEAWQGFDAVRQLGDLPPEVLLIPLHGHSRGHCGVAVDTGAGWLLHAGDAYFHHDEVHAPERSCSFGLNLFQKIAQTDGPLRLANQTRLRDLARQQGAAATTSSVTVFSAHDYKELLPFSTTSLR